ncbi:MAG TPA: ATP-binding protein [Thermoleophilaceae bacterium]|nr:ATP-binding protein [Thermoleophilaceae bacterium]
MESIAPDPVTAPTSRSVILRFAAGTLSAIAVAVVGGYFVLRSVAIDEAKRQTRTRVQEAAKLVEATAVTDGLLRGRERAVRAVDDVVVGRVLSGSIVRVKIWSPAGRVLYSDEPAEIGGRYALDAGQHRLLRNGGAEVEVTDLNRPENRLDRQQGRLLEAYTRIRTPSGIPLLFEIYQPLHSITADARRLLRTLAPPILGAIALILLVQAPLFWSLMRRLQRSHEQREGLLANAVTSSRRERRRVASYLHDGPVQELAGLAFSLAPVADGAETRGADGEAAVVRTVIDRLRGTVRDLRALLVDLHPPTLATAGLDAALRDLVSPLSARGAAVELRVDGEERLDPDTQALVYRVAQEAVRNVIAYADASTVSVEVGVVDSTARLLVADDGRGFAPETRERRRAEGHLGLSLVEELADQAGGRLTVDSSEGEGTRVRLEAPLR